MKYIAMILAFVLVVLCCRWVFNAVMATDWPDWVKYMVLK